MSETQRFWVDFERWSSEVRERSRTQYAKLSDTERRKQTLDARARLEKIMAELERKI